jgi:hypothetical protein
MSVDGFILSYGRANGNRVPVFHFPYTCIYRFSGWLIILLATCLLAGFCITYFFDPEDGGDVPPKRRLNLDGLHGIISQKMDTLYME